MKRKYMSGSILLAGLGIAALPAQAQDNFYFGVGGAAIFSDVSGYDSYSTQGIFAKVGKEMTQNLSVEALLGIGVGSDKWSSANGCDSQEVSTDSFIGAQLVGAVPISSKFSFHGNIGVVQTSATLKNSGAVSCYGYAWSEEYSESEVDLTYGIGFDIRFTTSAALTADYQIFYDDTYAGTDLLVSGLVVGYKQYF